MTNEPGWHTYPARVTRPGGAHPPATWICPGGQQPAKLPPPTGICASMQLAVRQHCPHADTRFGSQQEPSASRTRVRPSRDEQGITHLPATSRMAGGHWQTSLPPTRASSEFCFWQVQLPCRPTDPSGQGSHPPPGFPVCPGGQVQSPGRSTTSPSPQPQLHMPLLSVHFMFPPHVQNWLLVL